MRLSGGGRPPALARGIGSDLTVAQTVAANRDRQEALRQATNVLHASPCESRSGAAPAPGLSNGLASWRILWTDGEDLARHARSSLADQLTASRR